METQVLLSSVVTLPSLPTAFLWAAQLGFHGLELFPHRRTEPAAVDRLARQYNMPVKGIHIPFWWKTKSLWQVIKSEYLVREKLFAGVWWVLFGPGHEDCPAVQLLKKFPQAYCLLHPDTYGQSLGQHQFFLGHEVFLENERPKQGESTFTYDPLQIKSSLLPCLGALAGRLMFDPGHVLPAQEAGILEKRSIPEWYELLKPHGLHLSFSGEGRLHDLPTEDEWRSLALVITQYPPQVIVVETAPGFGAYERVRTARHMLQWNLGI